MYDFARQLQANHSYNVKVEIMPSVPVHKLVQRIGQDAFIEKMKQMTIETTFFTFVRNPISRFCSAMGQIAEQKRHVLQAVHCSFPKDAKREMACVLQLLLQGERVNNHLIPSSIELYQMMAFDNAGANQKKRVAVFPLVAVDDFLGLWDMPPFRQNEAMGIKARYSPNLLTSDMICDICHVYEVDVRMMRSLKMRLPECDAHIPTREDETMMYE